MCKTALKAGKQSRTLPLKFTTGRWRRDSCWKSMNARETGHSSGTDGGARLMKLVRFTVSQSSATEKSSALTCARTDQQWAGVG